MLLIGKKSGDGPLAVICFPIAIMKWAWSEKHECISPRVWDGSGTILSYFSMASTQSRKAMNLIQNGKVDEHPEMYIHYGYKVDVRGESEVKAYVRVFVQTEDHCTLEYRDGDCSLLFSSSYSIRNPSYAVFHKTKCIPIDLSTQKPYLRCTPYIIRRKHPSHYTFSSVSLFHGSVVLLFTVLLAESTATLCNHSVPQEG